MNRALIALAAAAAALAMLPASAWPCGSGGGSSSGGSSGGGGSGGGGGSSSSSSSSAATCQETSAVVGRQQCGGFGRWDVSRWPRLSVGFGSSVHAFSLAGATFDGTTDHDGQLKYRLVDDDLARPGDALAATFDMRLTGRLGHHLYVGAEVGMGGAAVTDPRVATTYGSNALRIDPSGSAVYFSYGAIAGARLPLGRFVVNAEAVAGARSLGLSTTTSHDACVAQSVAWNHKAIVESRVGVQTWLSPWWSTTVWLGRDLLDEGGSSFGVVLQGHMRAFDGGR